MLAISTKEAAAPLPRGPTFIRVEKWIAPKIAPPFPINQVRGRSRSRLATEARRPLARANGHLIWQGACRIIVSSAPCCTTWSCA